MRFTHDDAELTIGVELEPDDPGDLEAHGLGRAILDAGVTGILDAAANELDPAGHRWAPLRPATVRAKGHDLIGVDTGQMLADLEWAGEYWITPRSATWRFPAGDTWDRASRFHNGVPGHQAARPLIGWTDAARAEAHHLYEQATADQAAP